MIQEREIVQKPKKNKNGLYGIVFIIINIFAVVIAGIISFGGDRGVKFSVIFSTWMDNYRYFIYAFLASFLALFFEILKYFFTIWRLTKKKKFKLAMKTAVFGKYYDNITPFASGGQPMQMYYLNKGGIPLGIAGSLPIVGFFFVQLAFVAFCLIAFIFNGQVTDNIGLKIMAYVGSFFAIIIPFCLVLFSLIPNIFIKIAGFFIAIASKIKLIRNKEKVKAKIEKTLNDYRQSIKTTITSKSVLFIQLFFSFLYQLSLCSIPYFVLKASGTTVEWFDMFCLCIIVYAAISFIPTPGNSGAAEISFGILFTTLSQGAIFWAMALWRFASYYCVLLIGICFLVLEMLINRVRAKKNQENLEDGN